MSLEDWRGTSCCEMACRPHFQTLHLSCSDAVTLLALDNAPTSVQNSSVTTRAQVTTLTRLALVTIDSPRPRHHAISFVDRSLLPQACRSCDLRPGSCRRGRERKLHNDGHAGLDMASLLFLRPPAISCHGQTLPFSSLKRVNHVLRLFSRVRQHRILRAMCLPGY